MIDYSLFSKEAYRLDQVSDIGPWDIFLSGYNLSDRVRVVFDRVDAAEKHWLVFPEYRIAKERLPRSYHIYQNETREEDIYVRGIIESLDLQQRSLCVDCTGILRPHLLFLIRYLAETDVGTVDFLYTEPDYYRDKEQTNFAGRVIDGVRPVRGYEGGPIPGAREVMIIGAGYDPHLISAVCLEKEDAVKVVLVGFPPLKPEMYQESYLRISKAEESLSCELRGEPGTYFVPANDPFETAYVLQRIVEKERTQRGSDINVYLCPLATKAQTLGFAIYYQVELQGTSASIYFPFSDRYSPDTSRGFARVWRYIVDYEIINKIRRVRLDTRV